MVKLIWLILILKRNRGIKLNDLCYTYGYSKSTTLRDLKVLREEFLMDIRSASSLSDGSSKGYVLLGSGVINQETLRVFDQASSLEDVRRVMRNEIRVS